MNEAEIKAYNSTIKSYDTEEFLDLWIYRPYGYKCALFFKKHGVHPTVITIILNIKRSAHHWWGISPTDIHIKDYYSTDYEIR